MNVFEKVNNEILTTQANINFYKKAHREYLKLEKEWRDALHEEPQQEEAVISARLAANSANEYCKTLRAETFKAYRKLAKSLGIKVDEVKLVFGSMLDLESELSAIKTLWSVAQAPFKA